jgi:AcrR family transcriptional regulator
MADGVSRRLSPEVRSAEILDAAKRLLDRVGARGFSLEAVAREARVAASLPRHYFGSSVELLGAATVEVLKEVERALRAREGDPTLADRFSAYLDVIRRHPWGHSVWMRSAEIHPSIDALVRKARNRMGEAVFKRPWSALTRKEQIHARGWVGFVEAVVSDWIERGFTERELVLEVLIQGIQSFQPQYLARRSKTPKRKPATRR